MGAIVLAGAVLTVHFAAVFLHVAPPNPIAMRLAEPVQRYVDPFFVQNWQLFAPKPINEDNAILVRARVQGPDGIVRETGFLDMTTPKVREHQGRRYWSSKSVHLSTSALMSLEYVDPIAENLRVRFPSPDPARAKREGTPGATEEPEAPATPDERKVREQGERYVTNLASHAAEAEWGPGVRAIQVRVARYEFPRFSQRDRRNTLDEDAISTYDLPWTVKTEVSS